MVSEVLIWNDKWNTELYNYLCYLSSLFASFSILDKLIIHFFTLSLGLYLDLLPEVHGHSQNLFLYILYKLSTSFEKHAAAPLNLSVIFLDRKQCDSLLMLHMIIYIGDIESYITYHLVNCTILFNCVKEYQQHSWNSLQLTNYAQGANHKGRFDDPGGGGVCRIRTIDCFSSAMLLFYPDVKGRVV